MIGARGWAAVSAQPLLRAPPFPGQAAVALQSAARLPQPPEPTERLLALLAAHRVGGSFWLGAGQLIRPIRILARPRDARQAAVMCAEAQRLGLDSAFGIWWRRGGGDETALRGECDPWSLFGAIDEFWLDQQDPLALIALSAGCKILCFDENAPIQDMASAADLVQRHLPPMGWRDPFSAAPCSAADTIALLGFWRQLIDSNRPIGAALGFARWKRATVAPLLWGGKRVSFSARVAERLAPDRAIAVWKSKMPAASLASLGARSVRLFEVEDGFIRSAGLGADCVPPLSIVVDAQGVHFDPARPSALETMLATAVFSPDLRARARELLALIINSGVSKYGVGGAALARPAGARRHVLVTGQVEDDRSVACGAGDVRGNLDLLRRARAHEPDSYILYKPHPDVDAGHRVGHIPDAIALQFADEIVRDPSIAALLDMIDAIHVMTSLAGFEALLRGKQVVTHGVPFYAGWGLTHDLGAVPARRGRALAIDELVGAVLLVYPRYLDPVTRLPCPPEVMIARLIAGVRAENRLITGFRRAFGRMKRLSTGLSRG